MKFDDRISCSKCGKRIPRGQEWPATNHPEALAICFDCLPEDAKKRLAEKSLEEDSIT